MKWNRIKGDFRYILLNVFVLYIPCWRVRRYIYKILGMKIGAKSRIGIGTKVISPSNIIIGNRTVVNEFCHLDGRGGLFINDDVSISIYTKIITASHRANSNNFEYYQNGVFIGDRVWIGCSAIILDGSKLNDNCIIGAGTVFKGSADCNGIYIGNPSRKIKDRMLDSYYMIEYNPYFR